MTKRKLIITAVMFIIAAMLFALTALAADDTSVEIGVQAGTKREYVTVTVGEVFNITEVAGKGYTITGVKPCKGYSLAAIKEIHIPYDATEVNFGAGNGYIEKITFDDYSKAMVTSLTGLVKLKEIQIGSSTGITFKANCAPVNLNSISFVGKESDTVFEASAFLGKINLNKLKFAEGNTYSFGKNCFQNTGLVELNLVDGATFTFAGEGAFYGCKKLKSVYLGDGIKAVTNSPFDNCGALQMVYVQAASSIADYTFRTATSGNDVEGKVLKVYIHTQTKVTIGSNAFANRNTYGVVVCALETNVTSFSNCKYELHYGIPHAYEAASEEVTCYNTYTTDCPCQKVRNAQYKLYASGKSMQEVTLISGSNPDVPHKFTAAASISYKNGIDANGTVEPKCCVCGTLEGVERVAPAIVCFPGYSISEGSVKSMVVGIRFNSVSLKQYEDVTGQKLSFGLVLSSVDALNGNDPIKSNGEAYANNIVYRHNMSGLGFYESTLKVTGLKTTMLKKEFYMLGYIKMDDEILYIGESGVSTTATSITYVGLRG